MNFPAINAMASSGAAQSATGSTVLKFAVQSHLVKGLGMGMGMGLGMGIWMVGIAGVGYLVYRKWSQS